MRSLPVVLLLTISVNVFATNYVVIGAFSKESNAIKLSKRANAEYDINHVKQLYYVFVLKTEDRDVAFAEVRRLQSDSMYKDAWVFQGVLGAGGSGVDISVQPSAPGKTIDTPGPTSFDTTTVTPPISNVTANTTAADPKAYSKDFFFNVMYESGTKANGAEISVIEPKSERKEYIVKGNENVTIKAINQSGAIRLECDLAGYRKIVQYINFQYPDSLDGVTIENNHIIVPFTLVRLKKGDHTILYNVFFYKDAAIMRPESKFDLDGLLGMMNENSKYKIRIHGHTNGSSAGRILEASDPANPFSLNGAKEGAGSAKKLSLKRAEVIRNYLISLGVDPSRMTTKAWGGKMPIYDKFHTQASANVRVEVEVLED